MLVSIKMSKLEKQIKKRRESTTPSLLQTTHECKDQTLTRRKTNTLDCNMLLRNPITNKGITTIKRKQQPIKDIIT